MKARGMIATVIFCLCMMISFEVFAEEVKFEVQGSDTIKNILEKNTGKEVIVRLNSGAELQGIVTKVGDVVVHLSKISSMNFYDAVIRIDGITAVLVRVRSR